MSQFPFARPRRLRINASIRSLVAEHFISVNDFIVPLFIEEGKGKKTEISSMPNYYRYSLDKLKSEIKEIQQLGLKSVLLFVKVPDNKKDNTGKEALNPKGLMQQSIQMIKDLAPELYIMTDVALDPYSIYGHDGIVENKQIINDTTNEVLAEMSLSHAQAGADCVAPSDMMDGRILMIREALENEGFGSVGIMSYAAKYASCFYGPFRDALDSAPGFGDKKTYQMNPANVQEALREVQLDVEEGADIVMVKPGIAYLDVLSKVKNTVNIPVSVYQVSGEYAMIKAAAKQGWLNEQNAIMESAIAFKRAGADLIASYFAKDIARLL